MKKRKWLIILALAFFLVLLPERVSASSIEDSSIYNNPHVIPSPDGKAWTTDAGEQDYKTYPSGTPLITGETGTREALLEGQHEYPKKKEGLLLVEKWLSANSPGHCSHAMKIENMMYHGLPCSEVSCLSHYKTGWLAVCADCHEEVPFLFYMDEETALTLKKLPLNMEYFYRCPWCTSLEQGTAVVHECKENSWNRYSVEYRENGAKVTGIMPVSTFMYNNETMYEGQKITQETRLRKNRFVREGYEFVEWNTKADGSGKSFTDEQEIFNLTTVDNEEIVLFAQWKKSESTLHIHPGSGKLDGASGIVSVTGKYGATLGVSGSRLTPPAGAVVSFDTNGGTAVADRQTTRYFKEWSQSYPFNGELEGEVYHFTGPDGSEDTITAIYGHGTIVLPDTQKDGLEFGGWYKDEACTQLVGPAGAEVIITQNTTLYAQWVSLQLTAVNDYSVYGGSGAVDLNWTNAENTLMTYQVYQQRENGAWNKLKQVLAEDSKVDETFSATKETGTYTVPYSGLYTLSLTGAQGESYTHTSDEGQTTMPGGKGGRVKATVFLHAGEVLTYNIGTTSGYNGGGTGDPYGNGGGMTSISSNKKGTLLVAGGGGGASSVREGGPGGAETSLTVTSNGGSGAVGGGGGYLGGNAGEALYHVHDDEACSYHEHDGDDTTGGDCYVSDICGGTTFDKSGGGLWYTYAHWNNDGSTICVQCGYNWVNGGRENGHSAYYPTKYTCKTCGASFEQGNQPASCSAGSGYALSCTIPEGYNCGKTDKTIESAKTAYGGSNYANAYCTLLANEVGVGTGDGSLHIYLESVECVDGLELSDVAAKDMAPPEAVSTYALTDQGTIGIRIDWTAPPDRGTIYYHQVVGYDLDRGREHTRSNITGNILTSGLAGYYVLVDENPHTAVNHENGTYLTETSYLVDVPEKKEVERGGISDKENTDKGGEEEDIYLHIAAVDRAGNLSDTTHIKVEVIPFSLLTYIQRILAPHEPLFKAGESGILQADIYGYARQLEVFYPGEWMQWGFPEKQVFDYGREREYLRQETLQFMVPLKAPEGEYSFRVRAYSRGGEELEETLQIQVKGSVLDELRTRLR